MRQHAGARVNAHHAPSRPRSLRGLQRCQARPRGQVQDDIPGTDGRVLDERCCEGCVSELEAQEVAVREKVMDWMNHWPAPN